MISDTVHLALKQACCSPPFNTSGNLLAALYKTWPLCTTVAAFLLLKDQKFELRNIIIYIFVLGLWTATVFCSVIKNTGARTLEPGSISSSHPLPHGRACSRNWKVWTWICVPVQNYVCKFLNFIKIVKQLRDFSADKLSCVFTTNKITEVMK